ncbi:ead/Ea22-like family protein [Klebsiella pneumoniae]|uniref:ead/Ea22-like family protein n=1 Tax=Klebsiella pneumoniae TaxID=573 RepID=UPI001E59FDFD|nr:ead/Ea22-like family protein [Klebsiella pneumoniae]MCE0356418.1 ead/Ea22-like family protein [Klebsiella pneumoniae]
MNISTVNELIAALESAGELSIREQKFLKLAKAFKQLAAENKRLTDVAQGGAFVMQKALMKYEFGVGMTMQAEDFIRDAREKHSATDRIVAGIKADGRVEGAHFVANRMLAAWDAGFIEDSAKNAADIARMILTSTEFMADAPEGDFDRSFADGILEDIAKQLREGGDK